MRDFSKEIRAYGLKNAIEFGKADAGRVLPKLFQHGLEKLDIKKIMPEIQKIVKEVNSLKKEEREMEFDKYGEFVKEGEKGGGGLPELPNVSDKMVFRLAPYPSGALHLGNAKTYMLNALYAEKYNAKIIFVMDDTIGSEEKGLVAESYGLLEEAFQWLGVNYVKPILYKSDRMEIYYSYADKLIDKGKAYVCTCKQEVLRANREKGKECLCRSLSVGEQIARWRKMFFMKAGDAVLRIKTDMNHPNPAFRDRVLFKVSEKIHPRVGDKYKVWPSLEMSWAIDDHLLGITHILRGNDLRIETDMEKFIWDIFGWKHPETIHSGMIKIEGMGAKISKSKAQKEVLSGELRGWDDPRTWSIQSIARRGIKPESIRSFIEEIGLNKQDIIVPIEALYSYNRKLIDGIASRHSFVENAKELNIEGAPEIKEIKISVHPDRPEEKRAVFVIPGKIFISEPDFRNLKEKEFRLLHLYNIKLDKRGKAIFTSEENKEIPRINWVSESVKAKILMENGSWISGLAEKAVEKLKIGEEIQFERFGFCRFDNFNKKENCYEFWFSHK
jgi:glutamyl-tRNA synthetase